MNGHDREPGEGTKCSCVQWVHLPKNCEMGKAVGQVTVTCAPDLQNPSLERPGGGLAVFVKGVRGREWGARRASTARQKKRAPGKKLEWALLLEVVAYFRGFKS